MKLSEIIQPEDNDQSDWEIYNYKKLDRILIKLCLMVIRNHRKNPEKYGMVGAAVLGTNNRIATGISLHLGNGKWQHAEKYAMKNYYKKFGEIPSGSICITTCSPCSEIMSDRDGESCMDLINRSNIHKVYAGFIDPTQPESQRKFNIMETGNKPIRDVCEKLASFFLDHEKSYLKV